MLDINSWIRHADEVLAKTATSWNYPETLQFATSMIAALYGAGSPQMKTFQETRESILRGTGGNFAFDLNQLGRGTIKNAKGEVEAGLIGSVRAVLAGEIIAELLALAKEISADSSEAAKNVSAVLVAAGFEDLIRRMGTEFAGVAGRPKLEEVIGTLKHKDVLKGGEGTTALGYLKFRNESLHADWNNVERSTTQSCLAFVEALLVKHFSG